jgi:hypothetical protein
MKCFRGSIDLFLLLSLLQIQSPNRLEVAMLHGAPAWLSSRDHPNFVAAARAIRRVYQCDPDYTREGGSIPIASALERANASPSLPGRNILLLPLGACDDMAHSQNEKYNVSNLMNGVKVLSLYLEELGEQLKGKPKPSACRCEPLTQEELSVPGAFLRGFRCKCEM